MIRTLAGLLAVLPFAGPAVGQATPIRAALLAAQGEYRGVLTIPAAGATPVERPFGAQVVAFSGDDGSRLRLVLLDGGLPGDGWRRGDPRVEVEAAFTAGAATFESGWRATLGDDAIRFRSTAGDELGELQRVTRASPTLGATPPPGAVVLFDGSSADAFENGRLTEDGHLAVGCDSKRAFGDQRIHLEFRTPLEPHHRGQKRGNSGVYVQGRYECQVLDSFGLVGKNNECGGIYSVADPIVNACLPPATWQTYDIRFTAARYHGDEKIAPARMTVHLNGILVQDDVAVPRRTTASKRREGPEPGGLVLQDHGNPVVYRNIWVVEDDPWRTRKVVMLAGRRSHGFGAHEHHAGCLLLARALERCGLGIDVEVIRGWPEDPQELADADVLVVYSDGGRGHPLVRHLGAVDELLARGVGFVCLHYAVEVPKGVPGDRFVNWLGGYFETDWSVNPHWTAAFTELPEHPITRGVRPFELNDEWYFHMRFRPRLEAVTPILSAIAPASTMARKDGRHSGNPHVRRAVAAREPQHVAWAVQRPDGGRGFGFTGGHVHWNWGHDDCRRLVLNAIVWCAHLGVPAGGVQSVTPGIDALLRDQDFAPPAKFDRERMERRLESFRTRG